MNRREINSSQALNKEYLLQNGFVYGWVMELDRLQLKWIKNMEWDSALVIEARFFTKGKEIHVFGEEEKRAINTENNNEQESFVETQLLQSRYGEKLFLRHYIDYDDDGQAFIYATCLEDVILEGGVC